MLFHMNVKRLYVEPNLPKYSRLPEKAHDSDFGIDFFAAETKKIWPGHRELVSLGIATEFTQGFGVLLCDRSGVAVKGGLHVIAGVIDCDYRGEWSVCLVNLDKHGRTVERGDKIVQGIVVSVPFTSIAEVASVGETERGTGGFGSTGT